MTPEYLRYLKTPEWQEKRRQAFLAHGQWCGRCGERGELEVHHSNYDRLGNENVVEDLEVLCTYCHEDADDARREESYFAGVDTYMTKKYGYDWRFGISAKAARKEFDSWVAKKEAKRCRAEENMAKKAKKAEKRDRTDEFTLIMPKGFPATSLRGRRSMRRFRFGADIPKGWLEVRHVDGQPVRIGSILRPQFRRLPVLQRRR